MIKTQKYTLMGASNLKSNLNSLFKKKIKNKKKPNSYGERYQIFDQKINQIVFDGKNI